MPDNENVEGEDLNLAGEEIFNLSSKTVSVYIGCSSTQHSGAKYVVKGHRTLATRSEIPDLYYDPGTPGIFFERNVGEIPVTDIPNPLPGRSFDQNQEEFHDSEFGDVFTLYNVCNGQIHNGLLDIRKVDELSIEELKFLDTARLKEIWLHTASGCTTCEGIIRTLNMVRGSFSDQEISEEGMNQ